MAAKPLTEAIALTEKKINMTLDEIIKMTKKTPPSGEKAPRAPIKSQGFMNANSSQRNVKVLRHMDSRSSIRQGVLAQRRSNLHGNQFQVTAEVAKKAAITSIRNNWGANRNKQRPAAPQVQRKGADGSFSKKDKVGLKDRPRTLDALFANMKEQRMKRAILSQQQQQQQQQQQPMILGSNRRTAAAQRRQQRGRGAGGRWFQN